MPSKSNESSKNWNPNDVPESDSGIFALPFSREQSRIIINPVPWDVTTSYGAGTSGGPDLVLHASSQIDLFDLDVGRAYECGYFMDPVPDHLRSLNKNLRLKAERIRELGGHHAGTKEVMKLIEEVNIGCREMNTWVYESTKKILDAGLICGVLGGDHSVPLGAIRAISESHGSDFGILHLDAHADLRKAYEGFQWSHASIMYNVMSDAKKPAKLVQVGIRDFCEDEFIFIQDRSESIKTFFDIELKRRQLNGEKWSDLCKEIVSELPEKVYLSFDIDGLDPQLCPHTGTPVPGGLKFHEATELLRQLYIQRKKIVGFDLNEVSNGGLGDAAGEWDGNVGARLLYKMCGWTAITNGLSVPFQRR